MMLMKRNSPSLFNFPSFFDDFATRDFWGLNNFSSENSTLPSVNIAESTDQYTLEMAAPGMEKKDFKVELNDDVLTISAEKEMKHEEQNDDKIVRREFGYQSFKRTFRLAKEVVDESKIKASYKDGILRLDIPKKEEVKPLPPRTIEIK